MAPSRNSKSQITRLAGVAAAAAVLALSGCNCEDCDPGALLFNDYNLSATFSGLSSSGLVLAVNGVLDSIPAGVPTELLAAALPSGSSYSVTVATQPTGQTCTVAGGSGTVRGANVDNVVVTCSDEAYSLGGSITGLGNNSGLVLANGSDTLTVTAGATSFTLPTPVAYTSSYDVTVQSQPAGLACSVSNPTGTMPAAAVTSVQVSCTDQPFSLGGSISGLGENAGLVLANGGDTLTVTAGATSFTMPTLVSFGSPYSVGVQSSPAGMTCTASSASGTMPAANVTSVLITCSDQSYNLGGSITGLISGGLVLANGTDTLAVSSGTGSFNMPTPVAYGSPYDVTVQTEPSGLTCTPSSNAGTMAAGNVTSVVITCSANTYTVGGSISGLNASGLVLLDNGGDATSIDANATRFSMNTGVAYGAGYDVTVQTEPTGLVCQVSSASGTVGAGDVSSISIACVANTTILYSFVGAPSDGTNPSAGLIQGSDGNLYGTTEAGGTDNYGTVFNISPSSGAETIVYSFSGNPDGANPSAGLIQLSDGNLYGTTADGGTNQGTIFRVSPSGGSDTLLHSFTATTGDGEVPFDGLIQLSDGNLYGTTYDGGVNGMGTVFKISPSSGAETIMYSFSDNPDGTNPIGSLIQGSDGNLYGTTRNGGVGYGTVFKLSPSSGAETIVYSFSGNPDGANPSAGLIQLSDGNLYGTTYGGGVNGAGTVFKISPSSGAETIVYSFAGGTDGANPSADLIQLSDGNLYGTTVWGGVGYGTVFKLSPSSGAETIVYSFAGGTDGANPSADLIQGSDGNLYGTTVNGGGGYGTVFKTVLQ